MDDGRIRTHHDNTNITPDVDDDVPYNPFLPQAPEHFTVVEVDAPDCPLTREQVVYLDAQLAERTNTHSRSLESFRLRWITALELCIQMFVV